MTANEKELINIIRKSNDPANAIITAVAIIKDFIEVQSNDR